VKVAVAVCLFLTELSFTCTDTG
jgi:hypothetical protein